MNKLQCPPDLNQLSISQHSSNNGQEMEDHKNNQIKISKKCKDLNKLKQLKINDELRKLLQKDYSTKRSTCDRIVNKLKVIPTLKK